MAFVVKVPGSEINEQQLLEYCAEEITERAAIPKRIVFLDKMPLTAVGKIYRPSLRQHISELRVSEHLASESILADVSSELDKKRGLVVKVLVKDRKEVNKATELLQGYTFTMEIN